MRYIAAFKVSDSDICDIDATALQAVRAGQAIGALLDAHVSYDSRTRALAGRVPAKFKVRANSRCEMCRLPRLSLRVNLASWWI